MDLKGTIQPFVRIKYSQSFDVVEAVDAAEALKILDRNMNVDLLFTDIGLPGLNGRALAATVQRRYPKVSYLRAAMRRCLGPRPAR